MELRFDASQARKILLEVLSVYSRRDPRDLQSKPFLNEVARRLAPQGTTDEEDQVLLTIYHDLFRNGYLAPGFNIANPEGPWCHLTARGRELLKRAGRDPTNPDGYLEYLRQIGFDDAVARSYVDEALRTYNSDCPKAAAVMIGAATERMVLRLREVVEVALTAKSLTVPKKLTDWRYKTVRDALIAVIDDRKSAMPNDLAESYSAFWVPLTEQPRVSRNEAGHPVSIDPVTPETVHGSLLIFPELVRLISRLEAWLQDNI